MNNEAAVLARLNEITVLIPSPVKVANRSLSHMVRGKQGIVLGSGKNTNFWKLVGWKTLDIDPKTGADYIADVNYLGGLVPPQSQDLLFAEHVPFGNNGENRIKPERLIQQAEAVLKPDGILIVRTILNPDIFDPDQFFRLMVCCGFDTQAEYYSFPDSDTNKITGVDYFGQKSLN